MKILRINHYHVGIFLLLLFSLTALKLGVETRGTIVPDHGSESKTLKRSYKMSIGAHAYGIVKGTHYPNGPLYILLPFMYYGQIYDAHTLRLIPVVLSVLAFAFFVGRLFTLSTSPLLKAWSVFFALAFLCQPSFYAWQGTLHEFSLALSLSLVLIAVASFRRPWVNPVLWLIGFVSGWIGFDFLPPQCFAVLAIRLLVRLQFSDNRRDAVLKSFYDTAFFTSGVVFAVLTHLCQNALYFQSAQTAIIDLFYAFSLRQGAENTNLFFRHYPRDGSFIGTYDRLPIVLGMIDMFLWAGQSHWDAGIVYDAPNRWSRPFLFLSAIAIGTLIVLYKIRQNKVQRHSATYWSVIAFAFAAMIGSAIAWFVFMPNHSGGHIMFVPRHFLVGFAVLGFFPLLAGKNIFALRPLPNEAFLFDKKWKFLFLLFPALPLGGAVIHFLTLFWW